MSHYIKQRYPLVPVAGMDPMGNFWGCHDRAMRIRRRGAPPIELQSGPGAEPMAIFWENRRPRTYLRASEIRKFIKKN